MKMMKMMVLILSSVLCVSADSHHEEFQIVACSQSDGEMMLALDNEELWYADFVNHVGVDAQPSFADHSTFDGWYPQAEANRGICQENLRKTLLYLKNPPVELDPPSSPVIYPRDHVELGQKNVLVCHVSGFYPAPVNISWTKNREKVTEGISINTPFPSKDGSFNQFSRLEFQPELGDIYSCTVDHPALNQPLTRLWDVEENQPSIGPSVFCGVGLAVGLIGVAVGTFFLIKGNECS
nr:MHC class II antigen alpha chain [Ogcocephalus cubifrons]